jgi:hypothetical protein
MTFITTCKTTQGWSKLIFKKKKIAYLGHPIEIIQNSIESKQSIQKPDTRVPETNQEIQNYNIKTNAQA